MEASAPHLELLNAAYDGNLKRFKRLALNHAKGEGIGVAEAIGKVKLKDGRGCLHFAAEKGSLDVCKYLIENLKLDVNSKDENGRSPLYKPILRGHFLTVRYLLEKGADPDELDIIKATPLICAVKSGDIKIINLLLSRGVRVDFATRFRIGFWTPLCYAISCGHQNAVKVLLDHGANPNGVDNQLIPLFSAIFNKSWECMKLLLEAGADPNVASRGETPLTCAAAEGLVEEVTCLLEAGADPNHKSNNGMTALEIAAIDCNFQIVEILFPVTSRIPTYPDWSITGLMRHVNSDTNKKQREVYVKEKFHQVKSKGRDAFQGQKYAMALRLFREALAINPEDASVLSNTSACFAHLDDGINALDYATRCMHERPEWPEAYYRMGVAHNILKRYDDAADAFNKGLKLDPGNKELEDAYMKAIEAKLNSMKV